MKGIQYVWLVVSLFLAMQLSAMEPDLERGALIERERVHHYYVGCCALISGTVSGAAGIACGLLAGNARGFGIAAAAPFAVILGGSFCVAGCLLGRCERE